MASITTIRQHSNMALSVNQRKMTRQPADLTSSQPCSCGKACSTLRNEPTLLLYSSFLFSDMEKCDSNCVCLFRMQGNRWGNGHGTLAQNVVTHSNHFLKNIEEERNPRAVKGIREDVITPELWSCLLNCPPFLPFSLSSSLWWF